MLRANTPSGMQVSVLPMGFRESGCWGTTQGVGAIRKRVVSLANSGVPDAPREAPREATCKGAYRPAQERGLHRLSKPGFRADSGSPGDRRRCPAESRADDVVPSVRGGEAETARPCPSRACLSVLAVRPRHFVERDVLVRPDVRWHAEHTLGDDVAQDLVAAAFDAVGR